MIRSTSHTLSYSNKNKIDNLSRFIDEYRRVGKLILDDIWDNGYQWEVEDEVTSEKKFYRFDIKTDKLETPKYIDYNKFNINTTLSARALSSLVTQLMGIIRATTEKRRKRLYVFNKLCEEGIYNERLYFNLQKFPVLKPSLDNINVEVSSKCANWENSDTYFNGFLQLMSIGEEFGKIRLPIKYHRNNKKYADWKLMNSFLIGKDFVNIRWEKEVEKKSDGREVGGDQGKLTILTLSDRQTTPKEDLHGHSLDSIIKKLSTKKKGSKQFAKAQEHRKNFINWSINQLNLSGIKSVKLEEVVNIGFGRTQSRLMSHWTNTIIRDKVSSRCEESGVHFSLQACTYRSQRCSQCGLVRKSNRKGKVYICECGYSDDADYNASCNHEQTLPDIPLKLRRLNLNKAGFYWKETGFYDLVGQELRVPDSPALK